jgi:Tol biopolymer transport system component
LETCDVTGDAIVVVDEGRHRLPDGGLMYLCWLPDGRLIYPSPSFPDSRTSGFRVVDVDPEAGTPKSEPRRFLGWNASRLVKPSASSDGRRMVFSRGEATGDIYVLELDDSGAAVGSPWRLSPDDWRDESACWSPDGRRLFSGSYRSGSSDVLVHGIGDRDARLFVSGPSHDFPECVAPHSSELLFWRLTDPEGKIWSLMGIPTAGGAPRKILDAPTRHKIRCGRGSRCVLAEEVGRHLVLHSLDLERGKGEETARIELDERGSTSYDWDLSPDGSRVIVVDYYGLVQTLNLETGELERLQLELAGFQKVSWSAGGDRWVATGSDDSATQTRWIKSIDLEGRVQTLWEDERASWLTRPALSPDGRYVAFEVHSQTQDVWMIEGF